MKGRQLSGYVFLGVVVILFMLSIPYYKFAEHLFVGVSAAYWMCMGFWGTMVPNLFGRLWPKSVASVVPALQDQPKDLFMVIPLVLGILLLMRLSSKIGWIARWPLAFIVGTTGGLNLVRYLRSDFIVQIHDTGFSLISIGDGGFSVGGTISAILMFVGVMTGLIYFFFSKEHKGAFGTGARTGIIVLMITFGASFGYTVMARISLLVGRMQYLFGDWLGVIQ
jgi:hypothetical protein